MAIEEPLDYERLEEYLSALAYSSRLEMLNLLRAPKALQDIRLAPRRLRPGETTDRAVARQTVQAHLDKLMEVGLVVAREAPDRRGKEFVVNPQRLFQVLEELRKVGAVSAAAPAPRDTTVDLDALAAGAQEKGPRLLLVHGLIEGKTFRLRAEDLAPGRGWVIGRKPGLPVSLEYDPYVSSENAEIVVEGTDYHLLDLRSSKNGTWLNWRRLDKDERPRLASGDLVGVGRSVMVFRRE